MELTGDLNDFPLTDILQILALSRKTGTLALETGVMNGKIVIEQGRITEASLNPGGTFADRLIQEKVVTPEVLSELRRLVDGENEIWTLESLLVESGAMSREDLELATRKHIQSVVSALVGLERGRFGIALNQAGLQDALAEVRLHEGLDIGEVLLEAATEKDEGSRTSYEPGPGLKELLATEVVAAGSAESVPPAELGLPVFGGNGAGQARPAWGPSHSHEEDKSLYSFLAELRSHSFEAEVSLLIMRYASEVVSRGILFVVKETEVCGLGQFGVESIGTKNADERVREIVIPLKGNGIFDRIVKTGEPLVGAITDYNWHAEVLSHIGGAGQELNGFALPITCNDKPVFILYGDNYPELGDLSGIDALVTLVNQSSIVLEKIVLERIIRGLQGDNGFRRS
jgi:hypothetical protein